MSNITDYQMEQILFKLKANKNSKILQNQKLDILELEPEVKPLDEFISRLQKGEIKVNIQNNESLEKFCETKVIFPDGRKGALYEPNNVSENRKKEAYKTEIAQGNDENNKEKLEKKSNLAKYSVITLKDEVGKYFDLVIDQNGNDLGRIIYDKNGRPSFEISQELKQQIDIKIIESKARNFVEESTIQEEFYLKNMHMLVRAIEEGKVVPQNAKEAGERAIAAKNIKDNKYTDIDATKALILTTEEEEKENEVEELAKTKLEQDYKNSRLESRENERDIVEEQEIDDIEETTKNVQKQQNVQKKEENVIPEDKKDEIKDICKKSGYSIANVEAVLIIEDASTLADSTEESGIKRTGNEVTVVQFSDITGKDKYIIIQDGIELGGDEHDESFMNLIEPLHRTTGRVKRVEDEKTYVDYTDSSAEINSMKLKRLPQDMSLQEKERFKEKLEKDIANLEMVRANDPENKELIDQLELVVYNDFVEVGLAPPETIKEDAEETKEDPEESKEIEKNEDENDCYDEIGRRIRPH